MLGAQVIEEEGDYKSGHIESIILASNFTEPTSNNIGAMKNPNSADIAIIPKTDQIISSVPTVSSLDVYNTYTNKANDTADEISQIIPIVIVIHSWRLIPYSRRLSFYGGLRILLGLGL